MWKEYAASIGTTANNLTKQQKIQAEVNGILQETRFQTGDAAKIANTYSGQVLQLGFNFNNLKVAVGNAIIPILQAVLPVVNTVIMALTRLANAFAQVVSLVFGKQVTVQNNVASSANAAAQAQDNFGSSTKGAGSAAKKAQKDIKNATASIDELNIISKDATDSAGGLTDNLGGVGGSEPISAEIDFGEEITDTSAIENAINRVKKTLETLLDWFNVNFKPIFEDIWSDMQPNIETFKKTLSRIWKNLGSLGQPLKDWINNDFTPYLQQILKTSGVVLNGLFETFNIVFSDIWDLVIFPWLSKFVMEGLPEITRFATEAVKNFETFFIQSKTWFDALWAEGISPLLPRVEEIGVKLAGSFWNTFKGIYDTVNTVFTDIVTLVFQPFIEHLVMDLAPKILEFVDGAITDWDKFFTETKKWFDAIWEEAVQPLLVQVEGLSEKIVDSLWKTFVGLYDTAKMVFDDLFKIIIKPFAESLVKTILPIALDFVDKVVETWDVLFAETKEIFDMLWKEGVTPALELIKKIWLDLWESIKAFWEKWGKPIFDNIKTAIENTSEIFKTAWENYIKPIWENFMKNIDWLWTEHLKPFVDNFLDFVGELVNGALSIYNGFIAPVVKWFLEIFGPMFANTFNTIMNIVATVIAGIIDVANGLITFFKGIIQFLTGVFTGDWDKAFQGLKNITKGMFDALVGIVRVPINLIIDLVNGMLGAVEAGINGVIKMMNKLSFSVPDWIPEIGGQKFGFSFQQATIPRIPKLATGAVIPPNREFMAVLGDQRNGTNIEAPLDTIKQALAEVMGQYGGSDNSQLITLLEKLIAVVESKNLNIDGRDLLTATESASSNRGVMTTGRVFGGAY